MRPILLAAAFLLTALSPGVAADEIIKDDFEAQSEGQTLSDLVNWKYIAGWIKPEDGKVVKENGNKFVRLHGDIFARSSFSPTDRLTFRFKIRAAGSDEELGGLVLRSTAAKQRYDVLFTFKRGGVVLARDEAGKRDTLARKEEVLNSGFQKVEVVVERQGGGVKFTISINGTVMIEKEDPQEMSFLREGFTAGFFTYNQKTIDIDDVEFTQGK